jgi:hypothetical protein
LAEKEVMQAPGSKGGVFSAAAWGKRVPNAPGVVAGRLGSSDHPTTINEKNIPQTPEPDAR